MQKPKKFIFVVCNKNYCDEVRNAKKMWICKEEKRQNYNRRRSHLDVDEILIFNFVLEYCQLIIKIDGTIQFEAKWAVGY